MFNNIPLKLFPHHLLLHCIGPWGCYNNITDFLSLACRCISMDPRFDTAQKDDEFYTGLTDFAFTTIK